MDAPAPEACRFAYGIEALDGVPFAIQYPRLQVCLDPAKALARDNALANGDERLRGAVVDGGRFQDAVAIAAILSCVVNSAQLVIVAQRAHAKVGGLGMLAEMSAQPPCR